MDERTDAELMARVRDGDRDAFGAVMDRYRDPLVAYLGRLTGSRERGEEVAQEAFLRLYRAAPTYQEQGRLAPLLYRIAVNLVRSEERRARRFRALAVLLPFAAARETRGRGPEDALLRDETQRLVARELERLPLVYREPLVLRDIEDWNYEDIARALGCPEGTVKSRISRGRQQLKERLAPHVVGNGGRAWTTTG